MKKLIELNGNYIDADKVSFIGKPDVTIQHNINRSSKNYWFMVVVDGNNVTISAYTQDELLGLRDKLLSVSFLDT